MNNAETIRAAIQKLNTLVVSGVQPSVDSVTRRLRCLVPACPERVSASGLCSEHLMLSKIEPEDGCWVWTSSFNGDGYAQFSSKRVHRRVYELAVGPIAEGMVLDHLCRNRGCVNPDHLEVVTVRENTLRGEGPSARFARAAHCVKGHEFTAENTRRIAGGYRVCKTCASAAEKAYRDRSAADAILGGVA